MLGEEAEALVQAENVARLDPHLSGGHVLVAQLSLSLGDAPRALQAADRALALDGDLSEARMLRGRALEAAGSLDEAKATYAELIRRDQDHRQGRLRAAALDLAIGNNREAIQRLSAFVSQNPDEIEGHLLLGQALLSSKSYEGAVEAFQAATRLDEGSGEALLGLGRAHLARGQDQLAVIALQKAIRADDQLADAYVALGEAEYNRGFMDKALEYVRQARAINSDQVSAFVLEAQVLERGGDKAGMEKALRRAVEIDPAGEMPSRQLAERLLEQGRGQEAAAIIEVLAQRGRPSAEALTLGAKAWKAAGQGASAVALYRKAHALSGENALLRSLLEIALAAPEASGLTVEVIVELAEAHFQGSREDDSDAILMLARAHAAAGAVPRAREILQAASRRLADPRIEALLRSLQ